MVTTSVFFALNLVVSIQALALRILLSQPSPGDHCFVVGFPGEYDLNFNHNFQHHNAPTPRDVLVGSFFTSIQFRLLASAFFSGIHVGGTSSLSRNYAIPTTNRNFAISYLHALASHLEELHALNLKILRPYVEKHRLLLSAKDQQDLSTFFPEV